MAILKKTLTILFFSTICALSSLSASTICGDTIIYADTVSYDFGIRIVTAEEGQEILRADGKTLWKGEAGYIYVEEDQAILQKDGKTAIVDYNGNLLYPFIYDDVRYYAKDKIAVVTNDGVYGLVAAKGKVIIPLKYSDVYYDNGIATLGTSDNKWGMYNVKKKKLIKPKYDGLEKFVNGVAVIGYYGAEGNKYGLIDDNGKELVTPIYETMFFDESQQYASVSLNNKHGIIGGKGEILIPLEFDRFKEYKTESDKQGFAIVSKGAKQGAYNFHKKKVILNPEYDEVTQFTIGSDGFRYARDGKFGYVNNDGKEILKLEYDFIGATSFHGYLRVQVAELYGVVSSTTGEAIVPRVYDNLVVVGNRAEGPFFLVKKDGKMGVLNSQNEFVFDLEFDDMKYSYKLQSCLAKKGNQVGVLDLKKAQFITEGDLLDQLISEFE